MNKRIPYIKPKSLEINQLSLNPICGSGVKGSGDAEIDYGGVDEGGGRTPSAKNREDDDEEDFFTLVDGESGGGFGLW